MNCPCGLKASFATCCAQFIEGHSKAETPEQLMRSRYCAYTQANIEYIEKTMAKKAAQGFDPQAAKSWAKQAQWLGLTVLEATNTQVKFIARYKMDDTLEFLCELSDFEKIGDEWFYISGKPFKLKRNDPCPCLSGKKFKNCCSA